MLLPMNHWCISINSNVKNPTSVLDIWDWKFCCCAGVLNQCHYYLAVCVKPFTQKQHHFNSRSHNLPQSHSTQPIVEAIKRFIMRVFLFRPKMFKLHSLCSLKVGDGRLWGCGCKSTVLFSKNHLDIFSFALFKVRNLKISATGFALCQIK